MYPGCGRRRGVHRVVYTRVVWRSTLRRGISLSLREESGLCAEVYSFLLGRNLVSAQRPLFFLKRGEEALPAGLP